VYGIPCITLRENTERPETLEPGSSVLAGNDAWKIDRYVQEALEGRWKKSGLPAGWDGNAASRIALDVAGRIPKFAKSQAK
jgi:UDP-N-acetylglucosamine 2-epimerase (non-hydrolysing)